MTRWKRHEKGIIDRVKAETSQMPPMWAAVMIRTVLEWRMELFRSRMFNGVMNSKRPDRLQGPDTQGEIIRVNAAALTA